MNKNPDPVTETQAFNAIRIAQIEADRAELEIRQNWQSARLALTDAEHCFNRLDFRYARERALDSLAHSVGKFSPRYAEAASEAPFKRGDRVTVAGRYRGLVVRDCWQARSGWRVRAFFESGFGWYEGAAQEFEAVKPQQEVKENIHTAT